MSLWQKSSRLNNKAVQVDIMYIFDGIVYAGTEEKPLRVEVVEPLENYELRLTFSTGEKKIFDCKPFLKTKLYFPLNDIALFNRVYLDYGVVSWNDGAIDFSTSLLYENSI